MQRDDTIFALASGAPPAAIAVVRLSGSRSDDVLARLTRRRLPRPRVATRRAVLDPNTGALVDEALVLRFEHGRSYTGETSAELHLHGGRAVIDAVLSALASLGLRMAEPGEFTSRALLAGRVSLAEAEAIGVLASTESEFAHRSALRTLDGALATEVATWRAQLVTARSLVEASLDFADEHLDQPTTDALITQALDAVDAVIRSLSDHLVSAQWHQRADRGFHLAIIGPPNAGKSSLINVLTARDTAIVDAQPGTTRDVVSATVRLDGLAMTLYDTAGLRETTDPIEREGVRRALEISRTADKRLLLVSPDTLDDPNLLDAVRTLIADAGLNDRDIVFATKSDLFPDFATELAPRIAQQVAPISTYDTSAVEAFRQHCVAPLSERPLPETPIATSARRVAKVHHALGALRAARATAAERGLEITALHLEQAQASLLTLVADVPHDEVLAEVFARFCIGK